MQSKDIVIGKPYLISNRVCIVVDKGKFERAYLDGSTFTLEIGDGVYTEIANNYWYAPSQNSGARVVVWGIGSGRVDLVVPRQVDSPVSDEKLIEYVARYASREDLLRIQQEEDQRRYEANRRVAEIVSVVLGRDPNGISHWEVSDPWRILLDDKEFVKKTFMLYLKVLASKGEQLEGWDANELIEDIRDHARAVEQSGERRDARCAAATATITSTLQANSRARVYQQAPELEQVNA